MAHLSLRLRQAGALLSALALAAAPAAAITIPALDAGFVTVAGGSAKGDGTVTAVAKYNYSVGFELHYGTGALGSPLSPMLRRNYFVFDLSALSGTITSATLLLWAGKLESADSSELYGLKEITDMATALGLGSALAAGTSVTEFSSPSSPLVLAAASLYGKIGDGPLILGSLAITHAMDDTFISIAFTPGGLGYLNGFVGAKVMLGGLVGSVLPPAFPQQPFGFTGPDIVAGDITTPKLVLGLVPEPAALWQLLVGLLVLAALAQRWPRRR